MSICIITIVSRKWLYLLTMLLATSLAVNAESPIPVNLGTAADFVILAKTGVSVTGNSLIVGNVGVSPVAATFITGFDLTLDPSNTFSRSSLVTGKIYAADYTSPTPVSLTTAVSDMENAYTDAAGREEPDYTELYAGDVTGKTLTPGIYKWSTGVTVSSGGATISGSADDIWIFQIAQDLELASGAAITLTGGAQTYNIFWQIAGQVILGTTAAMKGNVLCQTAIVARTGAMLDGRALAQTAVTMDANTITIPMPVTSTKKALITRKFVPVQTCRNQSIEFTAPACGRTTLRIFNALGKEVATLFDSNVPAGKRTCLRCNSYVPLNGLYLSKLEFKGNVVLGKVLFVK